MSGRAQHVELEPQVFFSRLGLEQADGFIRQLPQLTRRRQQFQPTGLDAGDVEDIADQRQQTVGRLRGDLQGRFVEHALLGFLQGQFEHAQHRVHRRAYLMAHGRQEGRLGLVGRFGLGLGVAVGLAQALAFGDVDPPGNQALNTTVDTAVGQHPMMNDQPHRLIAG